VPARRGCSWPQLGAGVIQLLTGIPTWAAFALALVVFGVLYVLSPRQASRRLSRARRYPRHARLGRLGRSIADAIHARPPLFERGMVSADSYGFALGRYPERSRLTSTLACASWATS
jgi:uncharacterized protein YjeT (DUF2065 family)